MWKCGAVTSEMEEMLGVFCPEHEEVTVDFAEFVTMITGYEPSVLELL